MGLWGQFKWELEVALENEFVKVFQVLGLERYGSAEHGIKKNTKRPDVHEKAFISLVNYDFRG